MKSSKYIFMIIGVLIMIMLNPLMSLAAEASKDDFSTNTGLWQYSGNAYLDTANDYLVLTPNETNQSGIVWLNKTITLPFKASFRYKAGGEAFPGDGFTFMFNKQKDYSPSQGGGLSFDPGLGYGVEFDSYPYNLNDPQGYHIALIKDLTTNHLVYGYANEVTDNAWHDVSIEVSTTQVKVIVDTKQILTWNGTLNTTYNGIGFSAATGSLTNLHLIDNFEITSNIDLTSPVIKVNMENGTIFQKNSIFYLSVTAQDNGTGIKSLQTFLDGKLISNYQKLSIQNLAIGRHLLEIICTDWAGNEVHQTINFYVETSLNGTLVEQLDKAYKSGAIKNKGIYISLKVRLKKGNLISFIRELYAKKGKHITEETAQQLIDSAWKQMKGHFATEINQKDEEDLEELNEKINKKNIKEFKQKDKKYHKNNKHKNK